MGRFSIETPVTEFGACSKGGYVIDDALVVICGYWKRPFRVIAIAADGDRVRIRWESGAETIRSGSMADNGDVYLDSLAEAA